MSWFAIIGFLINYGPQIISVVMEIINLIRHKNASPEATAALKAELQTAMQAYKSDQDVGPLYEMRKRLHDELFNSHSIKN